MTPAPRQAALDWVRFALLDYAHLQGPAATRRAENLVAVAEQHGLAIEQLVAWICVEVPGKTWTAAEFRRYAERVTQARREACADR